MIDKIKNLAIRANLSESGEVKIDGAPCIELDDEILKHISGSSGNLDCTNKKDCRTAHNVGTCTNSGTCYTVPSDSRPPGP